MINYAPQGYSMSSPATPLIIPNTVEVSSSTYSTNQNDGLILVTTIGDTAITISAQSSINEEKITIKDTTGNAGINNITVTVESGTIDGEAEYKIIGGYDSITIICDGTNWWLI